MIDCFFILLPRKSDGGSSEIVTLHPSPLLCDLMLFIAFILRIKEDYDRIVLPQFLFYLT